MVRDFPAKLSSAMPMGISFLSKRHFKTADHKRPAELILDFSIS